MNNGTTSERKVSIAEPGRNFDVELKVRGPLVQVCSPVRTTSGLEDGTSELTDTNGPIEQSLLAAQ